MAGLKLHLILLVGLVIAVTAVAGGGRHHHKGRGGWRGRHHWPGKHSSSSSEESWENQNPEWHQEWEQESQQQMGHNGYPHKGGHHRGHHHGHHHWWKSSRGIASIFGIIFGGLVALVITGCLVRRFCCKNRASRISNYKLMTVAGKNTFPPSWSSNLVYKPALGAGFGDMSDGFMRIGPNHIIRSRKDTCKTDGAKWAVGMTSGKHVFEITWRWVSRGSHATIGLATEDAPLQARCDVALVGQDTKSWGFDIVKRRTIHGNKALISCPTDGSYVPDKFLMYVDMDEGTIGYGNDVTYWGEVVAGLPTQGQPLYLMVGATKWQSEISINYVGSAPEADEEKSEMAPPHHLPPLFHVQAINPTPPPTYTEADEVKTGPPTDAVEAGGCMPPPKENPGELPPPYTRPPVGKEGEKY